MCAPALAAIPSMIAGAASTVGTAVSGLFGAGAAATGAATGAATAGMTIGQVFQAAGTLASVGGTIYQAQQSAAAARQQQAYLESQDAMERQLAGIEDERTRARMRAAISQQRAELAGRGISLGSPTAILLGRRAAEEASYESQAVRSRAAARSAEVTTAARGYGARATSALLQGGLGAAAGLLQRVPDIWPGLADRRVGGRPTAAALS